MIHIPSSAHDYSFCAASGRRGAAHGGGGGRLMANSTCLMYLNQSYFSAVLVLVMHLNASPTCLLAVSPLALVTLRCS